jgi:LysM repeat protein
MKFSWPPSLKIPGLQKRTSRPAPPRTPARPLRASTALHRARSRAAYAEDEDMESEQPTTRLSTAFIVVVALHVVLVGGIYTFNSIKANRVGPAIDPAPASKSTAAASKPAPAADAPAANDLAAVPAPVAPVRPTTQSLPISGARVHQVRQGETLLKIAAQNGVTTTELANANGLKESAPLRVGQVLNIPAARPGATQPQSARERFLATKVVPKTHTVGKGETLMSIVRKYGVTYDELVKLNKIDDPRKLQIGQTLKLPQPKTTAAN